MIVLANIYEVGLSGTYETKLLGTTGDITLPLLKMKTEKISGAGILGDINIPIPGYFEPIIFKMSFHNYRNTRFLSGDEVKFVLKASEKSIEALFYNEQTNIKNNSNELDNLNARLNSIPSISKLLGSNAAPVMGELASQVVGGTNQFLSFFRSSAVLASEFVPWSRIFNIFGGRNIVGGIIGSGMNALDSFLNSGDISQILPTYGSLMDYAGMSMRNIAGIIRSSLSHTFPFNYIASRIPDPVNFFSKGYSFISKQLGGSGKLPAFFNFEPPIPKSFKKTNTQTIETTKLGDPARMKANENKVTTTKVDYLRNIKLTLRGYCNVFDFGKLTKGKIIKSYLEMEVVYLKLEYANFTAIEIDKLNGMTLVGGVDISGSTNSTSNIDDVISENEKKSEENRQTKNGDSREDYKRKIKEGWEKYYKEHGKG